MTALASATLARPRTRALGLTFVEPCYYMLNRLTADSVILDFGLGNDADFSMAMIRRFGLKSLGFDPTRRHEPALRLIEAQSNGHFTLHAVALGAQRGRATFHESKVNVSGSMLDGHRNVRNDEVISYDVPIITLDDALALTPHARAELVKVDIEGAEYDLFEAAADQTICRVPQWIVEYHHDTVRNIPFSRTRAHLKRFGALGFRVHTVDHVNYLMYRRDE